MSDGNWNWIGNRWKLVGKYMERNWKRLEKLRGVEGTAVMRGSAGDARLMGELM